MQRVQSNPVQSLLLFLGWKKKITNTATIIVVKVSYEIVMMVKLMSTLKGGCGSLCEKYNPMNQPHIHMPKTPWHIFEDCKEAFVVMGNCCNKHFNKFFKIT